MRDLIFTMRHDEVADDGLLGHASSFGPLFMSPREVYVGESRKLILGIDVGTTFSGVSFTILDPGVVPVIHGVNRYLI
jgi:hypothetical protein